MLANIMPSGVELSRVADALLIKILATGEVITDQWFFRNSGNPTVSDGGTIGAGASTRYNSQAEPSGTGKRS